MAATKLEDGSASAVSVVEFELIETCLLLDFRSVKEVISWSGSQVLTMPRRQAAQKIVAVCIDGEATGYGLLRTGN